MDTMATISLATFQLTIQFLSFSHNSMMKIKARFAYSLKMAQGFWINMNLTNIVRQNTLKNILKKSCQNVFLPYQM